MPLCERECEWGKECECESGGESECLRRSVRDKDVRPAEIGEGAQGEDVAAEGSLLLPPDHWKQPPIPLIRGVLSAEGGTEGTVNTTR